MKKIIVGSFAIMALLACKKNETPIAEPDPANNNYVRMKVNGVPVEIKGDEDNKAFLSGEIVGISYEEPSSNQVTEYFSCAIDNAVPNATGTYNFGDGSTTQMMYRKVLSPTSGLAYVAQNDLGHASLTITHVKNTGGFINAINGTFSGTLFTVTGNDSIVITDGEFFDDGTN